MSRQLGFYFCLYLLKCHTKRTAQVVTHLSVFLLFLRLTLFLTSGPLISSRSSLRVCLYLYIDCVSLFPFSLSVFVYTRLFSHPLSVCQTQNCFIGTAIINYTAAKVGCTSFKNSGSKKRQHMVCTLHQMQYTQITIYSLMG